MERDRECELEWENKYYYNNSDPLRVLWNLHQMLGKEEKFNDYKLLINIFFPYSIFHHQVNECHFLPFLLFLVFFYINLVEMWLFNIFILFSKNLETHLKKVKLRNTCLCKKPLKRKKFVCLCVRVRDSTFYMCICVSKYKPFFIYVCVRAKLYLITSPCVWGRREIVR